MTCVHTWLAILRSALEPPSDAAANTPVKIAPTMPPIACTPNTSSESSYLSARLSLVEARKHSTPAARPMISAPTGPTKPEAGVMATRPATAPEAVRRHGRGGPALALAEDQRGDEARDTRIDVHHGAAREVEHAPIPHGVE